MSNVKRQRQKLNTFLPFIYYDLALAFSHFQICEYDHAYPLGNAGLTLLF
jgi:hypothetical protein